MSQWVDVAKKEEIEPGEAKAVAIGQSRIAVFHIDGKYYACNDMCPHAGGPLHQGFLKGTVVSCPWHGWTFDLAMKEDAAQDGVARYNVRIENDMIQVEAP